MADEPAPEAGDETESEDLPAHDERAMCEPCQAPWPSGIAWAVEKADSAAEADELWPAWHRRAHQPPPAAAD